MSGIIGQKVQLSSSATNIRKLHHHPSSHNEFHSLLFGPKKNEPAPAPIAPTPSPPPHTNPREDARKVNRNLLTAIQNTEGPSATDQALYRADRRRAEEKPREGIDSFNRKGHCSHAQVLVARSKSKPRLSAGLDPLDTSNFLKSFSCTQDATVTNCQSILSKPQDRTNSKAEKAGAKESSPEIEDSEEEYEQDATPGPGAYDPFKPSRSTFRSAKPCFQGIFFSKLERFPAVKEDDLSFLTAATSVDNSESKSMGQGCFLSKCPKLDNPRLEPTPPPGYYNTRQTIEQDLVRNILKTSNSSTFVSRLPRPNLQKTSPAPGPGTYDLPPPSTLLTNETYTFKSALPRQLSYLNINEHKLMNSSPLNFPRPAQEDRIIHVKEESAIGKDEDYCESPPFLSGSQRFPVVRVAGGVGLQCPARWPSSAKENAAAFNSSSRRVLGIGCSEGVGVGIYNSSCPAVWEKKSFNLRCN